MFFKIKKNVFYNSLSIVSRAISSASPLPAFSGIKIEVNPESILLTGSDGDISIQHLIEKNEENSLEVSDIGSIVIESRYILEIVRKIDSEFLEIEILDGAQTRISGDNSEFRINGMKATEYPNLDFTKPKDVLKMPADLLKQIIAQTTFATSSSETKPVLTGVNFNCINNTLECSAADSYRLARKNVILENDLTFNVTIPARNLMEVSKSLEEGKDVDIFVSDKKIMFQIENTLIQSRLIDGVYPNTSRLIPSEFEYELQIDLAEILGAIDRASFIKSDGVSVIKLSLDESGCVLSSRSQEVGSSTEELPHAKFSGEHLDISFNGRYVFDALKALSKGNIIISFCGEMKPFVLKAENDDSTIQLVLPVRTYA